MTLEVLGCDDGVWTAVNACWKVNWWKHSGGNGGAVVVVAIVVVVFLMAHILALASLIKVMRCDF